MSYTTVQDFVQKQRSNPNNRIYREKYLEWNNALNHFEETNNDNLTNFYQDYLQIFPFNYKIWNRYAQYVAQNQNNNDALKIYQEAVKMNPRSLELWRCFTSWVSSTFKENQGLINETYDQCIQNIGYDFNAYYLWDDCVENYIKQNQHHKAFQLLIQASKNPLKDIENLSARLKDFLKSLNDETLFELYGQFNSQDSGNLDPISIKTILQNHIEYHIQASMNQLESLKNFEDYINFTEFEIGSNQDFENLLQYLNYHLQTDPHNLNKIQYYFEKALISQCDNRDLWIKYFNYQLKNQKKDKVLELVNKYITFFLTLDYTLLYLASDILEGGHVEKCVEIYKFLESSQNFILATFIRHLQLEIRQNQFEKAKLIYKDILSKLSNNDISLKSQIIAEYSELLKKHFKDEESAIDLVKQEIQLNGYNKQIYSLHLKALQDTEQIFEFFQFALQQTKDEASQRQCLAITQNHIRNVYENIIEIKLDEQKLKTMFESNLQQQKQEEEHLNRKRSAQELEVEKQVNGNSIAEIESSSEKKIKI